MSSQFLFEFFFFRFPVISPYLNMDFQFCIIFFFFASTLLNFDFYIQLVVFGVFFFFVKYSVYIHIHGTKIRLLLHRTNSLTQTHLWMQLRMFDEQYRKSQKSAEYVLSTRSQLNFYISHKTFFLLVFPIQSVSFQPLLFITHQNCLQNYWKICIYKWRLTLSWSLGGSLLILYLETKKKNQAKKKWLLT